MDFLFLGELSLKQKDTFLLGLNCIAIEKETLIKYWLSSTDSVKNSFEEL